MNGLLPFRENAEGCRVYFRDREHRLHKKEPDGVVGSPFGCRVCHFGIYIGGLPDSGNWPVAA